MLRKFIYFSLIVFGFSFGSFQEGQAQTLLRPPWLAEIPIPKNETMYLVVKGTYSNRHSADQVQKFIKQLMGTTPPDQVDLTDKYTGVNSGRYLVGMLFDSRKRALWWINFSHRNRKVPKGIIKQIKVVGDSQLPYMPDAVRLGEKRLLTKQEALAKIKALSDIKALAARKRLIYKFTDYPRNGDLRYEIEVMESKGRRQAPIMVDFIMVSALDGKITERLSRNLRKDILKEH